jgi:hypothetical protein
LITPFDKAINVIKTRGFHNHRLESHSDVASLGIFDDLIKNCEAIRKDIETNEVHQWLNVPTPGARGRKIDLLIAKPLPNGKPNLKELRLSVENKSVVTAHRNCDSRFDDLNQSLKVLHGAKPEAVKITTILVGVAERVLNVPDRIKPMLEPDKFVKDVLPRLSSGDQTLWTDFPHAISKNRPDDAKKTVLKFGQLTKRPPGQTHIEGYDYVLIVPVNIDNVNPPSIARTNSLGIDFDQEYQKMLDQICKAYTARWHL